MSFQPIIPLGGLPGWVLLNKTMPRQTELFNQSPQIERDTEYFEKNIDNIRTAEALVSDRRLLGVALGAFGLSDDLDSRALIQQVLESSASDNRSLANRLADERYKKLAGAFGFGEPGLPRTRLAGFATEITDRFRAMEFEAAVGNSDESLRLALNARREIVEVLESESTEDAQWFTIMGTPPLRRVFEIALGLPKSFGQLDIDRQLENFKEKARDQLGIETVADLTDKDTLESFVRRYLLRDQIASVQVQSSESIALSLLQSAPRISGGGAGFFSANTPTRISVSAGNLF